MVMVDFLYSLQYSNLQYSKQKLEEEISDAKELIDLHMQKNDIKFKKTIEAYEIHLSELEFELYTINMQIAREKFG